MAGLRTFLNNLNFFQERKAVGGGRGGITLQSETRWSLILFKYEGSWHYYTRLIFNKPEQNAFVLKMEMKNP